MSSLNLFSPESLSVRPRPLAPPPPAGRQAELGQYMTPPHVAEYMAALFDARTDAPMRLLEPGAGRGALLHAALQAADVPVSGCAVELDPAMRAVLAPALVGTDIEVVAGDFVEWGARHLGAGAPRFTHALLNPPYRKLGRTEPARERLRAFGIESPNLYAAFVSLALELLEPGGQLVALIPRSFCNGAYFTAFRRHLLRRASLDLVHVFESRTATFRKDGVLQENVIVKFTRGRAQGSVRISVSTDDRRADQTDRSVPFGQVVRESDPGLFLHLPTHAGTDVAGSLGTCRLADLGIDVSTGPVVDFRVREALRPQPEPGTVPLIYPAHFDGLGVCWPRVPSRKPNALVLVEATRKSVYASGAYCVIRRLSSKEEARRLVAAVVTPADVGDVPGIAFENHVNVFHRKRRGLPVDLARGLALYLSSSAADQALRRFSGSTQVNVGDLKHLGYPSEAKLRALGQVWPSDPSPPQDAIDSLVADALR